MGLIGIISDIHSNLEALKAVLQHLNGDGVEQIVHLGDLVGYNASPKECLRLLRKKRIISVLGNHDLATCDPHTAQSFNVMAHQALRYSRESLQSEDLRYLESLPKLEMLKGHYLLCHGTPESMETYIGNVFQAKRSFNLLRKSFAGIRVCFFGHTHFQKIWVRDHRGKVFTLRSLPETMVLEPDNMYLINPGSVGQPRQKDSRARYLLFDPDSETLHFRAVSYNVAKAQQKILKAELPPYLAIRLEEGV